MNPIGIFVAFATSVSWAACGMFFTSAGRRIGVFSMNNYRVLMGLVLLVLLHTAMFGRPLPAAGMRELSLLAASGIIGVVIGDTFLYQSYVDIGPRLGILIFNVHPFLSAVFAWSMLGEKLKPVAWLAMFITIMGSVWVVSEKAADKMNRHPHYFRGIAFAILGAVGQSFGFVIAKPAITGPTGIETLSAALIRVASAAIVFWLIGFARGSTKSVLADIKDRRSMLYIFGGAITGPALGIWLSLAALKLLPAGVAATIIATMPVSILPMVAIFYKERISWRAAIGAAIAVAGVALLVTS